jgi:hypothetical protein
MGQIQLPTKLLNLAATPKPPGFPDQKKTPSVYFFEKPFQI